jgi:dATP pyrophosphohydrolase
VPSPLNRSFVRRIRPKAPAPFQVLILPCRPAAEAGWQFAVFRRADGDGTLWQFLAGGGEDGEIPEAAARREMAEEAGIDPASALISLAARGAIPTAGFKGRYPWADELDMIPEYAFAVPLPVGFTLQLSHEHLEIRWLGYEAALALLAFESNRVALAELKARLDGQV